jgi:DNA polymerase-3 subunit delta'
VEIIDAADEMNDYAANALLKTLEQPAPHAAIVLIAPRLDSVLPTVASRCRHIPLATVPMDVISAHLARELSVEPDAAAVIATASRGRAGWAIRMAQDPSRWQAFTERQAKAEAFESATPSDRFIAVDELIGRGRPLQQAEQVSEWLEHIGSVNAARLRAALRSRTLDADSEATTALSAAVARTLRARDAQSDILRNVTPRLVFEDLALRPADGAESR